MRGVFKSIHTPTLETRFHFKDFIKVFALSIVLFGAFSVLFGLAPGVMESLEGLPPVFVFIIQYLIQFVVLFFPLWIFVVNKYQARLEDFGFMPISWKVILKTVLIYYLIYIALSFGIAVFLDYFGLRLPGYESQSSYLPLFGTDFIGIVVGLIFVSTLAPFLEEMLFRGFVYRIFTKTWWPWLGSLFTAALFALAHMQLETFFPLFILGLLLNFSYSKTQSVWTAVAFHSLNNTIAFSVDIYLTLNPEAVEQITALLYTVKI